MSDGKVTLHLMGGPFDGDSATVSVDTVWIAVPTRENGEPKAAMYERGVDGRAHFKRIEAA